jgi:YesN/AraC family two-component response regulator
MKTILIVDDELSLLEIFSIYVEDMNMRPIVAETGVEALEIIKTEKPDIALIDLTFPRGPSGIDLVKKLKTALPDTIFIVMSGYSDHDVMINPQAYGFHGRLLKPFTKQDLKKVL